MCTTQVLGVQRKIAEAGHVRNVDINELHTRIVNNAWSVMHRRKQHRRHIGGLGWEGNGGENMQCMSVCDAAPTHLRTPTADIAFNSELLISPWCD